MNRAVHDDVDDGGAQFTDDEGTSAVGTVEDELEGEEVSKAVKLLHECVLFGCWKR